MQPIKLSIVGAVIVAFFYAAYHVVFKYTLLYTMFLCYP